MKTQKAVNKKSRILLAAAKVLAEKGYSLTTLADVGAEAGTFAGSLYYYFPSKESIVEEVLNIGTTSVSSLVMARVQALPKGVSAYDRIRIALETHLQQMLAKDDFVLAYWKIIDQVPEEIRAKHLVLPREYGHFWQSMLEEAQAAGEIRPDMDASLMRLLIIGSTIYALQWFNPEGKNSPKEIADLLAEMFFLGVVPRGLSFASSGALASLPRYEQPSSTSDSEDDPTDGAISKAATTVSKAKSKAAADAVNGNFDKALTPRRTAKKARGSAPATVSAAEVSTLPNARRDSKGAASQANASADVISGKNARGASSLLLESGGHDGPVRAKRARSGRSASEAEAHVNGASTARRSEAIDRRSSATRTNQTNATSERRATSKPQAPRSGRGKSVDRKTSGEV